MGCYKLSGPMAVRNHVIHEIWMTINLAGKIMSLFIRGLSEWWITFAAATRNLWPWMLAMDLCYIGDI